MLIRYFAAARAAAGVTEELLPSAATGPAQLRATLADRHGPTLAAILDVSTYLVDGHRVNRTDATDWTDATEVDILPPFAGG